MSTDLLDLTKEDEFGHDDAAGAPLPGIPKMKNKNPSLFIQQKLVPMQVNVGNVQGPKVLTSTGQKGRITIVLPPTRPQTVNNNYFGTTISGNFSGNSGPITITAGLNVTTNNNAARRF
jgi:hypothetical protein